jgi:hypothetical protein
MKMLSAVLIALGIIGLIFSAIFPVILGVAGLIGSLALLLTGLGFFLRCCYSMRK